MASEVATAVLVDGVSKTFRLPHERVHTIKERALHPFRRTGSEVFTALDGVSFSVAKGEFFGVVGRNGSGKSTLLKCMAGIYAADTGQIYVDGRLSTFIELGVGFNPDLPARDNILLNATMLGLSPREARKRFDRIIDFAELRDFVDLKLKNYSSGMLVRLAFSVMIQVDAEILLIDEVLAVGDASFQQKCFDEFGRIRRSGTTVLLVTHDMGAVDRFCDRAMLLEHGEIVEIGEPAAVGQRYLRVNFEEQARYAAEVAEPDPGDANDPETSAAELAAELETAHGEVLDAWFEGEDGRRTPVLDSGTPAVFCARVRFDGHEEHPEFTVVLRNSRDVTMFAATSYWTAAETGTFEAGEEATMRVRFENILAPDRYRANVGIARPGGTGDWVCRKEEAADVQVTSVRASGALVEIPYEVEVQRQAQPSTDPVAR
jgi:ABC-type polysaccharide/polyol phosphate transport system ATPase subunit